MLVGDAFDMKRGGGKSVTAAPVQNLMDKETADRIREIEKEILSLAHLEAKIRRYVRRGCDAAEERQADQMLVEIDQKIIRCNTRIKALEKLDSGTATRSCNVLRFEPIEVGRPVRFISIDVVEPLKAAA